MTDTHSTTSPTESTATDRPASGNPKLRWGSTLIGLAGLLTFAYGVLFLYRTYFTEEFEAGVATLGGVTRPELAASHPEVLSYVNHLHVNLAALFLAVGIALAALAWFGVRDGQRWALATAVVLPVVFFALSLPVHQTVAFDFHTLAHMGPAALGGPVLVAGVVLAYLGLRDEEGEQGSEESA